MSGPPLRPGEGIALALGGGAALGWAHIGVLRALERAGVPVGAVAGTSMGALAAVCLAAGKLDALETIARGATRARVLGYLAPSLRRGGLLGGRRVARELAEHLGPRRFEDLAIPAAAVAADLATGEEVRLAAGSLAEAVQASIALPGVFHPVRCGGRRLIDGGMVANLPLAAARALAPALPLVAVDVMGDYRGPPDPCGAPAVMSSAFLMMIRRQTRLAAALDPPALLLTLPVGQRSTGDFHRADELIATGESEMQAHVPAILALLKN